MKYSSVPVRAETVSSGSTAGIFLFGSKQVWGQTSLFTMGYSNSVRYFVLAEKEKLDPSRLNYEIQVHQRVTLK